MFEATRREDVLRLRRPGTRWLSTGWDGGRSRGPSAYWLSVPTGWDCADPASSVDERLGRAGFAHDGPTLLTGVDLDHARRARAEPVEVVATVGLSNPAALPVAPAARDAEPGRDADTAGADERRPAGTVNLAVGTTRALDDAALAELIAVAAEAKAGTLVAETGFTGTTTDAVVAATDPAGEPARYAGSATAVGAAARACVREAVRASLASRYPDGEVPASVGAAEHGVETTRRAEVSRL